MSDSARWITTLKQLAGRRTTACAVHSADRVQTPEAPPVDPAVVTLLEEKISGLKELVESERKRADGADTRATAADQRAVAAETRITDVETDRNAWREQAQRLARPWWKRLAG